MAKGFKHGTSSPLNFRVAAYATEDLLKADTPKENTIGVVTTIPISGWYFAAEQPENMSEGEVWFLVGTSKSVAFNVLKKNNVTIYPMSAKQMVSGALKAVTAKSYQNGEWTEWNRKFYEKGTFFGEYVSVTDYNGTITPNEANVSVKAAATNSSHAYIGFLCDLTSVSKLTLHVDSFVAAGDFGSFCGIFVTKTSTAHMYSLWNGTGTMAVQKVSASISNQDITLDVSGINEEAYVWFGIYGTGKASTASISLFEPV